MRLLLQLLYCNSTTLYVEYHINKSMNYESVMNSVTPENFTILVSWLEVISIQFYTVLVFDACAGDGVCSLPFSQYI